MEVLVERIGFAFVGHTIRTPMRSRAPRGRGQVDLKGANTQVGHTTAPAQWESARREIEHGLELQVDPVLLNGLNSRQLMVFWPDDPHLRPP
jgi:hypothetical protein